MRGPLLLVAVLCCLPVEGRAAGSTGEWVVRPMRTGPTAPAAQSTSGTARPADAERTLAARLELWRRTPHHLSDPRVDWSPRANRRVDWLRPARPLRNPHLRDAGRRAGGLGDLGPEGSASAIEPSDTVRVAFLRIDFETDRAGSQTTGNGRFDLSGPDPLLPPIDRPPRNRSLYLAHLEALRRYVDAQSYGRVVVEGDVWPRSENGAFSVSDMADFGPWKFSPEIFRAAVHMFRTMMFAADSQSIALGDRVPWDRYDRFMIIHAGSDFQSDLRGDSPLDIPSFTIGVADTDVVIFPDSTHRPIDRCAVVPETVSQDGFYGALNGVIAHENGHNLFGFADLYDTVSGFPVVGLWSLMDSGNLAGSIVGLPGGEEIFAVGLLPPSLDPFHRFFAGDGLEFGDMSAGDTLTILDSQRTPDVRRLFLTSDEYLLLETRFLSPVDTVVLDQDPATGVVLGPKRPDRLEYDALLPGGGLLVWHIDASVVPFETAFRVNPDLGFNSNPARRGVSLIEADGLADLGDPSSPFILGSPLDPFFLSNNAVLSDTTTPNLRPHLGTRPHARLDVLDDPGPRMRVALRRAWQLPGWPVAGDFPAGGPLLLAVDADGDRFPEICWAGGADDGPDATALFAVRPDGRGLDGSSLAFARLDRRPRGPLAALPTGEPGAPGEPQRGPALFAASTYADGPDLSTPGGRVWLVDHRGEALPGWPAALPTVATTAPVIAGGFPSATVYVGGADGHVYAMRLDGSVRAVSEAPLPGAIAGRLAVDARPPGLAGSLVAAGSEPGSVAVLIDDGGDVLRGAAGWPRSVGGAGFQPDFLWIDFDGRGAPAGGRVTCAVGRSLILHHADRLWAFCADGFPLPGWGRSLGDTLVAGLGAGDPDGDGYAEVLTQSRRSGVAFWNQSGYPSPGWPKRPTRELFRTDSPPLVADVDGDGRPEVVALNASGILAALDARGRSPSGWPLATGVGAVGSLVAVDLNRDGSLEIVAPDRAVPDSLRGGANGRFGSLHAFSLPTSPASLGATSWTMLAGDPGRTSTLSEDRSPSPGPGLGAGKGPYVPGSLKAYPNPARRRPVQFAYQLVEPAEVEFRILDASGHQLTSFRGSGRRADNLEVWDPGDAPAGLYMAKVRFRAGSGEHDEVVLVGVIR